MNDFGRNGEPTWLALLADLVGSRRVADRGKVQGRLVAAVDALNARHETELAAPLAVSRGDEVQGLFAASPQSRAAAVSVVVALADALHPVEWRCGLGWGGLTTPLGPQVVRLDGPAFHRARAALERAQAEGRWLAAEGLGSATERPLEGLFALMQAARRRWTDRQLEFIRAARDLLQKDVAAHFEVSPSTVSESLKAAGYGAVLEGEAAAETLLSQFGIETESGIDSAVEPMDGSKAHGND
ncbi:MAG: SatD family protein [Thermoanaerobaculia bacterium]